MIKALKRHKKSDVRSQISNPCKRKKNQKENEMGKYKKEGSKIETDRWIKYVPPVLDLG